GLPPGLREPDELARTSVTSPAPLLSPRPEEGPTMRCPRSLRPAPGAVLLLSSVLGLVPALRAADEHAACPGPAPVLQGPILSEGQAPPRLPPSPPEADDKPLPINLAAALRLAGARPVIIAAAEAGVQVAAAQLDRARVVWLPSVYVGAGGYHHDG